MNKTILFMIIMLLIHHYILHMNDTDKTLIDKIFQYDDIDNHETWILFLVGILIGNFISSNYIL